MTKPKTILIVEDEKVLQDVYKLILSTNGYTVLTANNGIEGLTTLRKAQPDLVMLDIFMPVMDGREFLRNIDKDQYPNTTIIVCSNTSDITIEEEVLVNGADKFVLKSSLAPQELLELVSKYLR